MLYVSVSYTCGQCFVDRVWCFLRVRMVLISCKKISVRALIQLHQVYIVKERIHCCREDVAQMVVLA